MGPTAQNKDSFTTMAYEHRGPGEERFACGSGQHKKIFQHLSCPALVTGLSFFALFGSIVGMSTLPGSAPTISVVQGDLFLNTSMGGQVLVSLLHNTSSGIFARSSSPIVTQDDLQGVIAHVVANITSAYQAALAQEVSRAMAAESALHALIAALNASSSQSMASILSTENAIAGTQTSLASALASEISRVTSTDSTLIYSEMSRVMPVEASIASSVGQEVSRAASAEASLSQAGASVLSNLDSEIQRASGTESSLALSVRYEAVRAEGLENSLSLSLALEKSRALFAEVSLSTQAAAEASLASWAESSLASSVSEEKNRAVAVEASLSASAGQEVIRAAGAEASLASSVAAESSRALGSESSLSTSLIEERSRAAVVESSLALVQQNAAAQASATESSLSVSIANEMTRAMFTESSIASSVSIERSRALAAENAENARATAVETSLSSALLGEKSRAVGVEASLASSVETQGALGGAENPALSCSDLLSRSPQTPSGVYWIQPTSGQAPFQVLCDMTTDGGGWTMVYRVVSGSGTDAYSLWTSSSPQNEAAHVVLSVDTTSTLNYVNRLVTGYWNSAGVTISQARVHVYTAGALQCFVKFNAAGSSSTNWFGRSTYVSSSWTDILSNGQNFFSLIGDPGSIRRFYINQNYGGCPSDVGWIVASSNNPGCPYESNHPNKPAILCSAASTAVSWSSGSVAVGDLLAVFVK